MKLPKTAYIMIDGEDNDQFLHAQDDIVNHAKMGETVRVGVYKLVKIQKVKGVAITNDA